MRIVSIYDLLPVDEFNLVLRDSLHEVKRIVPCNELCTENDICPGFTYAIADDYEICAIDATVIDDENSSIP